MAKTEVKSTQIKEQTILVDDMRDFGPTDGGSLNLNVAAGRIRDDNTITDKAAQVVALTDATTNFVEITSVGVASANTSAFTSGSTPIAQVVTSGGSISSITDKRSWVVGGLAGGGEILQVFVAGFTRDMTLVSGTQAITGVGFTPRLVIFLGIRGGATDMLVGIDNGSGARDIHTEDAISADTWSRDPSNSMHVVQGVSNQYEGKITSLDSDGFTITWVKSASPTGTLNVQFMALR